MSSITIRDLDNRLTARLKARAAQGGRSVEEEAQLILQCVLEKDESTKIRRSAPPIAEGLGSGEAAGDRREQSLNLGLLLDVLSQD